MDGNEGIANLLLEKGDNAGTITTRRGTADELLYT
jgi:hypothetical protein